MIQNLIITNHGGLALFARSLMCNIGFKCTDLTRDGVLQDKVLLKSALFTAKILFEQIQSKSFYEFEMEKTKVLSYITDKIITMYALTPDSDLKNYENRLKLTAELFERNFDTEIKDFQGNIRVFTGYQEIIVENGLLEEGERFRANCLNCTYDKACQYRVFTGPIERTLEERINSIEEIKWYRKVVLFFKGIFLTRYFLTPKIS
jgi:hypothetical protein